VDTFENWLLTAGTPADIASALSLAAGLLLVAGLAFLANLVAKRVILRSVNAGISRSRLSFFLILQQHKVFTRLSHLAPAVVIQSLAPRLFSEWPSVVSLAQTGVNVYLICVGLLIADAILNVVLTAWERTGPANRAPIKGFIQAVKLIVFLLGLIFIVSIFLNKEPLILISGLGALTAVLLLVFKDALLGFVAGIQLSVNDMVKKGDWIEMPKQGADGDVIDVSLTTVKVQNWDRTITTIPSYLLISDSFRNWRGMVESGGRRIKRSIYLDMRSVRFLDEELLERFLRIRLLRPYLERKLEEIQQHNRNCELELGDLANGRHLTNIGTFRAYCIAYLQNHGKIHQEMIQLVRQLEPTPQGLPLEIYVFTNDIGWVAYEGIQADIFDHLLAILPHFGLRVYQQPSGGDLEEMGRMMAANKFASPTPEVPAAGRN
jgi:miniconductance mechanosensitive channel